MKELKNLFIEFHQAIKVKVDERIAKEYGKDRSVSKKERNKFYFEELKKLRKN